MQMSGCTAGQGTGAVPDPRPERSNALPRGSAPGEIARVTPDPSPLPRLAAARYVQPLREGGSLPAVVETDDGGLWVVKFRGAGQGVRTLVAELLVGMLAQAAGLPVPELAIVEIDPAFARGERDLEIQDLLRKSHGPNVGLRYLDGAFNFEAAAAGEFVGPSLAARIVWFDAFVTNPDRTHRNPNLLVWQRRPYLIDHGAALYAHHDWDSVTDARARAGFPLVRQHVLLALADDLAAADAQMLSVLTPVVIRAVLARIPDELLAGPLASGDFATAAEARSRYAAYLEQRLESPRAFVAEAADAREHVLREPPRRLSARR